MDNAAAMNTFFDASVRVGCVIWLAANTKCFDDFEVIEELIEDASDGGRKLDDTLSFLTELPEWARDEDGFVEWLLNGEKLGFLVRLDTPIPTIFHDDGRSYTTAGFGYFHSHWIYVDDLATVPDFAAEWQGDFIAERRAAA